VFVLKEYLLHKYNFYCFVAAGKKIQVDNLSDEELWQSGYLDHTTAKGMFHIVFYYNCVEFEVRRGRRQKNNSVALSCNENYCIARFWSTVCYNFVDQITFYGFY